MIIMKLYQRAHFQICKSFVNTAIVPLYYKDVQLPTYRVNNAMSYNNNNNNNNNNFIECYLCKYSGSKIPLKRKKKYLSLLVDFCPVPHSNK